MRDRSTMRHRRTHDIAMTEADIRRLSRGLDEGAVVILFARDGTRYIGCPLALRMETTYGRLVGEVVMQLEDGTKEPVDFGEIIQVCGGNCHA